MSRRVSNTGRIRSTPGHHPPRAYSVRLLRFADNAGPLPVATHTIAPARLTVARPQGAWPAIPGDRTAHRAIPTPAAAACGVQRDGAPRPAPAAAIVGHDREGYAPRNVTGHQPRVGAEKGVLRMTGGSVTPSQEQFSKLDTNVSHSARVWNYWLGGKDNFAADRQVGDQVRAVFPGIVENARATRA